MGNQLKTSICVTIFNEEKTIENLLQSLFSQTHKPTEIVICDGGSRDRTVQLIKSLQRRHKYIKLIISPGNVAHGRNQSIKHAKGDIIACIDAGCIARRDWLKKLVGPYLYKRSLELRSRSRIKFGMTEVNIVAGFYEMKWTNSFQKIMALYRGTPAERYDVNTFIPSCRSVAFKKKVWGKLNGFDESLSLSGEDTDFFYRAVKEGYSIKRIKNAVVYWNEPMHFGMRDFKKFYYYARGDAQTGIWWDPIKKWRTHNVKITTIYFRYLIILFSIAASLFIPVVRVVPVLFVLLYLLWSIWKWRDVVTDWKERLWIPVVQIGTDVLVMSGFLAGLIHRK
jgi:glycosyltransferase involved in cell wall biosynthesis